MNLNLSAAVARQLEPLESAEPLVLAKSARMSSQPVTRAKPVLQLNSFPLTLDPTDYADPKSNTNPEGSLTSLFAFRQLVDPIPAFTEHYSPSGASTERVYGNVVNSANVIRPATYAQTVVSKAKQDYEFNRLANLDGTIGNWRPIYATPEDWCDVSQTSRFQTMDLDLSGDSPADSPYIILGDATSQPLKWSTANAQQEVQSSVRSIRLKYLAVNLVRPWLNFELFELDRWYLGGQEGGYVSTGERNRNSGVLPLLPTVLLVGIEVQVTADWTSDDHPMIQKAIRGQQAVSLGPFALSAGVKSGGASISGGTVSSGVLHVVGWLSSLVPKSPPMTAPRAP